MKRWKRFLTGALSAIMMAVLLVPSIGVAYAEEAGDEEIASTSVSSDTDVEVEEAIEGTNEPETISTFISAYASSTATFQRISAETALDAEYGFSFDTQYKDVSDGQGVYSKSTDVAWVYADCGTQEWINYYNSIYGGISSEAEVAAYEGGDHWCAILDETQDASYWCDGRIWFRWNDVGYYMGGAVDLKVTLIDVEKYNTAGKLSIQFCEDTPGCLQVSTNEVYGNPIVHPTFKFEFFEHGSDTPISMKGHATFFDIDGTQGMAMGENIVAGYYLDTGWLDVNSEHNGFISAVNQLCTNNEPKGWFTAFYSGTYFTVTYCTGAYGEEDYVTWNPPAQVDFTRPGHPYCGDFCAMFGFRGESVGYFDTPYITKRASTDSVYTDATFTYYLEIPIPLEDSTYYYDTFVIQDVIPDELYIPETSAITVRNKTVNWDITSWFANTSTEGKVELTAEVENDVLRQPSLYGSTLEVAIPVAVRSDISADQWQALILENNGRLTSNSATLQVSRAKVDGGSVQTRTSNTVDVAISAKTQVQVINGSYSWSSNTNDSKLIEDVAGQSGYDVRKVPAGDDEQYSFTPYSGYVLKSVIVNGEAIDIAGMGNSFTYDFPNIQGTENRILVEYEMAKGSVTLNKLDGQGNAVSGVEFRLDVLDSGKWIELSSGMTDGSGQLVFDELTIGTYRVVETSTGDDLSLLAEPFEVSISTTDLNPTYTVMDEPILKIPHTGSVGHIPSLITGLLFLCGAICMTLYVQRKAQR